MTTDRHWQTLSLGNTPDHPKPRPAFSLFNLLVALVAFTAGSFTTAFYLLRPDQSGYSIQLGLAQCSANQVALAGAFEAFRVKHHQYPQSQYELVPVYLKELPVCSAAGQMSYRTSFDQAGYLIECCGDYHRRAMVQPYSPRYDSRYGLLVEYR